jgi:hypothetical protein
MNGKLALAALAALTLVVIGLLVLAHRPPGRPTAPRAAPASPPTASAASPGVNSAPSLAGEPVTATQVAALLPLGEADIAAGVELTRHFIAAYSTWRYDQAPQQYLAPLLPLASAQLRPQLQTAAADPTLESQRRRLQETSRGQAHAQTIRTLGPTSITVLVAGIEHITTPSSTHRDTSLYAVTVTRTDGDWRVDAIELATTGDTGDTPQGTAEDGATP